MQRRQTGEKISLSAEVLCNYIMPFFNWNIQKIHQNIVLYSSTISSEHTSPTYSFPSFKLHNSSDISDLIRNYKTSTCNLDPHLVLFRSCLLSLVPLISVKTAAINRILKKKLVLILPTSFLINFSFPKFFLLFNFIHFYLITCCVNNFSLVFALFIIQRLHLQKLPITWQQISVYLLFSSLLTSVRPLTLSVISPFSKDYLPLVSLTLYVTGLNPTYLGHKYWLTTTFGNSGLCPGPLPFYRLSSSPWQYLP